MVKAKLVQVFLSTGTVYNEYLSLHPEADPPPDGANYPNGPKMLRLGFHGCLRTSNGTGGGCNGCLNPRNMRTNVGEKYDFDNGGLAPEQSSTDNNGLGMTLDVLEEIYTNRDFPKSTPVMPTSLAKGGKSRADLWAFAALVAAEWGIERNNHACLGIVEPGDKAICQHIQAGTDRCVLNPPILPTFRTGRRDCEPDKDLQHAWQTYEQEIHPSVHGNGVQTADFFKEQFGMTARESSAVLIGAHSYGQFHAGNSMFKYSWTRDQTKYLNNQLFRHLAMKPQYKGDCARHGNSWSLTGDYLGQPAETRWLVRGNKHTPTGGPWQWAHWYYRCISSNDCARLSPEETVADRNFSTPYPADPADNSWSADKNHDLDDEDWSRAEPGEHAQCCENLEEGWRCRPDLHKCHRYVVNDETALSADVGYMFDFQVSEKTGLPLGCPVFDSTPRWNDHTTNKHDAGPVDCPLQKYAPEGEPLHAIIEEYADSQDAWLEFFLPGLEHMLANNAGELEEAPSGWWGAACERGSHGVVCTPAE